MPPEGIENAVFVVGAGTSEPWCVWEWDLRGRNARFLEQLDPDYFRYVADSHLGGLDGEQSRRAAVAIRLNLHHALETLFTLIGAALQAPDCAFAWVPRCKTGQLRDIVRAISGGHSVVLNKLGVRRPTWAAIAEQVFAHSHADAAEREYNAERFARTWHLLSQTYLEENAIAEHNSLKHGFRVRPGGFSLAVGEEDQPGERVPAEKMKVIGHSKFGTSFFVPEQVAGSPEPATKDRHFRAREHALNWIPEADAGKTYLAAMSMQNVVSFLRILNGTDPSKVRFTRPQSREAFDEPWSVTTGVTSVNFDPEVHERDIIRGSREDILRIVREGNEVSE